MGRDLFLLPYVVLKVVVSSPLQFASVERLGRDVLVTPSSGVLVMFFMAWSMSPWLGGGVGG